MRKNFEIVGRGVALVIGVISGGSATALLLPRGDQLPGRE